MNYREDNDKISNVKQKYVFVTKVYGKYVVTLCILMRNIVKIDEEYQITQKI